MSEIVRLRRGVVLSMSGEWTTPPVPRMLHTEIAHLKKMLGGGDGGGRRPPADRMREAVLHFWQHGTFRGLGDARLACFGAIERLSERRPPLIEHASAFPRLLERVDDYALQPRPFRRCYRGLLHCYFSYDPGAAAVPRTGIRNWEQLRDYLNDRYDAVRLNGFEPEWVGALAENRQLLTEDPAKPYARAALEGDTEDFSRVCREIEIAEVSWLVRELVLAQVDFAARQSDAQFKEYVKPLLQLLQSHSVIRSQALALVVNRYAEAKTTEEHAGLLEAALTEWKNPLLAVHLPKWGHVTEQGRRMMANWLKLGLIQEFFEVLAEDRKTDPRRVEFWKRHHEHIDGMYFALGSTARYSRAEDIRSLRNKMGDLQLRLVRGGASANNAFIMLMGDYAVVEFGAKGNACFVFERARLPFSLRDEVAGDRTGLKHDANTHRLLHVDTSFGPWEKEFTRVLSGLGIAAPDARRQQPVGGAPVTHRGGGQTGTAPATRSEPFTRDNLYRLADRMGAQITDKTQIGGSLFVHYSQADGPVASTLKAWGFQYGPTKKAWYRRGWS